MSILQDRRRLAVIDTARQIVADAGTCTQSYGHVSKELLLVLKEQLTALDRAGPAELAAEKPKCGHELTCHGTHCVDRPVSG